MRPANVLFASITLGAFASACAAQLPAFPGAQGFGAKATGGRGGAVVKVTTLALGCQDCGHPDGPKHHFGLLNGPDGGRIFADGFESQGVARWSADAP